MILDQMSTSSYCNPELGSTFSKPMAMIFTNKLNSDNKTTCSQQDLQSSQIHTVFNDNMLKFVCSLCSYSSTRKWNVKQHMKIHTSEKSFFCPYCPYEAKLKHHLERHLKTHIGNEDLSCPICPFLASSASQLYQHTYITHSGQFDSCSHSVNENI